MKPIIQRGTMDNAPKHMYFTLHSFLLLCGMRAWNQSRGYRLCIHRSRQYVAMRVAMRYLFLHAITRHRCSYQGSRWRSLADEQCDMQKRLPKVTNQSSCKDKKDHLCKLQYSGGTASEDWKSETPRMWSLVDIVHSRTGKITMCT